MSGFDTLALAENVANFPLPIITGIGHDRDESILDMVNGKLTAKNNHYRAVGGDFSAFKTAYGS
jgi:hypothetical protein